MDSLCFFFVKCSVAISLAADRPGGHHLTLLRVHNLNDAGDENENGNA
jgi:hypothetical protein